jgi:AraC-like DNA-binding protein
MRALAGASAGAVAVAFPLASPDDDRRHRAFFGCPVTWAAQALEVAFDASLLERPLPRADPHIFGYLARRADELLAHLPAEARAADRARREIGLLLAQGEPRVADVAKRLGLSERTLHRRLQEENTSFAALIDESRRDRAVLLLEDRRLSASEIAFLVGYSEPAPFFRAFRRWTGASPQEYRRRNAAA